MTAVDRAFIKAYTARRALRGNAAGAAATVATAPATFHQGATSFRIDGAHASPLSGSGGPHTKQPAQKPRRPSAEHSDPPAAPSAAPTKSQATHGQRVVVSLADASLPPDWIWQREPHPVFAQVASAVGLAIDSPVVSQPVAPTPAAKPEPAQPAATQPAAAALAVTEPAAAERPATKAEATKPSASRILSPEILALGLSTTTKAATAAATPAPRSAAATTAATAPLSSFTVVPKVEDRLQPALEVDRFLWPEATMELSDAATAALDAFAEQLLAGSINGQRRIAVVGATPAAGTTTVALCLARLARSSGATCGLLDANFDQPALASQLGITEATGWQAVLAGRERLADVSIASLDDQVTLVPLSDEEVSGEDLTANFRAPLLFSMLADAVDLMVIDGGTVDPGPAVAGVVAPGAVAAAFAVKTTAAGNAAVAAAPQQAGRLAALVRAARVDAVYVVYDERSTSPGELVACANRLRAAGITVAGAIANFTANGQHDSSTLGGRFDSASR